MAKVNYLTSAGVRVTVTVEPGQSIMRGAIDHNVSGIRADCGGECGCATCHVYVDPVFAERVPPPDGAEEDMLGFVAAERKATSRLSCQIKMTEALDGLVVTIPDTQ
ncbi:MAG TPA: 2Fe-2S iron-sulfur cluster-binding protein [Steroidobacteraceae bacterium]|nr:2Fe-2S iron-sulfur cluster-binding protein [Steroidobacteraceae bacterium]